MNIKNLLAGALTSKGLIGKVSPTAIQAMESLIANLTGVNFEDELETKKEKAIKAWIDGFVNGLELIVNIDLDGDGDIGK